MDGKDVVIQRDGRIAVVQFDRADNINALSLDMMLELIQVARSFEDEPDISAVVLTGSASCFSAGLDLRDPKLTEGMQGPLGERRRVASLGPKMCRVWEEMEPVTVAAIEGHCVGGGVSLAASCDFRIMGEGAFFSVPELTRGMNMSWQTIPRLVHLVGPARTKQIVILGERIGAKDALNWGFAQEIVPDGAALARSIELAGKIAAQPPLPVKMTKRTVNAVANAMDDAISHMDADQFVLSRFSEDFTEAISAFFDKRKPNFKGQ